MLKGEAAADWRLNAGRGLLRRRACDVVGALLSLGLIVSSCDAPPKPAPSAAPTTPQPTDPASQTADAPTGSSGDNAVAAAAPSVRAGRVGDLHYLELMTGGAKFEDAVPVIVAIHGLGDDPQGFSSLMVGFDAKARVILPRGLDAYHEGWSWFPLRARDPDIESLALGIAHAADTIATGIESLARERGDIAPVIVTGFSQGGMLTFTLATRHPELVSAAVAVGGWLPPPLWPKALPAEAPTLLALHGTDDPAVKFPPTQAAVAHLEAIGWPAQLHAYPGVRHAIPPEMRAELHAELRKLVLASAND